jgi:hypothetical protein
MSFLRHEEIYRSDVRPGYGWERQLVVAAPALIGCDEFPVGYHLTILKDRAHSLGDRCGPIRTGSATRLHVER